VELDEEDDLDDVLDEFTPAQATGNTEEKPTTRQAATSTTDAAEELQDEIDDGELERQMRAMLGGDDDGDNEELMATMREFLESPDFEKQMENFMSAVAPGMGGLGQNSGRPGPRVAKAGAAGASASGTSNKTGTSTSVTATDTSEPVAKSAASSSSRTSAGAAAPPLPASFQDNLRRTMERLQESDEMAGVAATKADAFDGMDMEALKRVFEEMSKGEMGYGENEEAVNDILRTLLKEMSDKEVLYEPMKELANEYPAWLAANRDNISKDDLKRYEQQYQRVREVVSKYEDKDYRDGDEACRAYIMERIDQMQDAGSHPEALIGGLDATQQALESMVGKQGLESQLGCPPQ
jgi:peroxin-19